MAALFFILAAALIFIVLFEPMRITRLGECHRCGRFVKPPLKHCSDCIPKNKDTADND